MPNRRAFLDGANRLLAQQSLDFEPLAVFLFDLDRFKTINDQLGHGAGDTVLQTFAAAATKTLGADILFARIGGEEFAAMLPVGDIGEAVAIADRVRRNFAGAAAAHATDEIHPSVSVGVTLGCDPHMPMSELLASADQALYRAKANGRNRVEAAEPVVASDEVPLQPQPAAASAAAGAAPAPEPAAV